MNKSHEKHLIKSNIANYVLGELLQGKKMTKADINKLIPEGVSLSAEDILKYLRDAKIWIVHKRNATPEGDTVWFMNDYARKSFLESPLLHKHYKIQMDKLKSERADFNKVQTLKTKYGLNAIYEALFDYHY